MLMMVCGGGGGGGVIDDKLMDTVGINILKRFNNNN